MAFRFSAIDRVPEPPSVHAAKGTLVHRALELLFEAAPAERTPDLAHALLAQSTPEVLATEEYADLPWEEGAREGFDAECGVLIDKYFQIENPREIHPIGLELKLEVQVGSLTLRGIIDRLDEDAQGNLIVTDYKTGKVPGVNFEQSKLGGVQFYAYLCEQALGRRPSAVQLLYLAQPVSIIHTPSDQSLRGLQQRTTAIWAAVERACEREDFRPKPSRLCDWCSFRDWCPAWGGDPSQAPRRAPRPIEATGVTDLGDHVPAEDLVDAPAMVGLP